MSDRGWCLNWKGNSWKTSSAVNQTHRIAGVVLQAVDGATVPPEGTPSDAPTSTSAPPVSYLWKSANNYITVLPSENEFDSKASGFVNGIFDATTKRDPTTFEASEGMAVFDNETQWYSVSPKPKHKSDGVYDELSYEDKHKFDAARFKEIENLLKLGALSVMTPEDRDHFAKTTPENIIPTDVLDKWKLQDVGAVTAKIRLQRPHEFLVGARYPHRRRKASW